MIWEISAKTKFRNAQLKCCKDGLFKVEHETDEKGRVVGFKFTCYNCGSIETVEIVAIPDAKLKTNVAL